MKKFKCENCGKYLGEMEKGKIHKKATILCEKCMEVYKTYKSCSEYKNNTNTKSSEFDNIFGSNGIFNNFYGKK